MTNYNSCLKLNFLGLCILFSFTTYVVLVDFPVEETEIWKDGAPQGETIKSPKEPRKGEKEKKDAYDHNIDWSDDIFRRSGWDKDPIVIESHKLLFFTVPKNACTTFKKLFRRMMGFGNWLDKSPHDPSANGLKYLGHYSRDQQLTMMTSPEWTRAIFVRDPLERALSAYMDKALHTEGWRPPVEGAYLKRHCCGMQGEKARAPLHSTNICREFPFTPYLNPLTASTFPFEAFVNSLMKECKDPHWQPQNKRMDKASNWKFINFVGKFENRMADTHVLLKQIGAFEEFGASGWGTFENKSLSIFETNLARHKTGSAQKMGQYYTPGIQERVFEHYRGDYELELFNLPTHRT